MEEMNRNIQQSKAAPSEKPVEKKKATTVFGFMNRLVGPGKRGQDRKEVNDGNNSVVQTTKVAGNKVDANDNPAAVQLGLFGVNEILYESPVEASLDESGQGEQRVNQISSKSKSGASKPIEGGASTIRRPEAKQTAARELSEIKEIFHESPIEPTENGKGIGEGGALGRQASSHLNGGAYESKTGETLAITRPAAVAANNVRPQSLKKELQSKNERKDERPSQETMQRMADTSRDSGKAKSAHGMPQPKEKGKQEGRPEQEERERGKEALPHTEESNDDSEVDGLKVYAKEREWWKNLKTRN
jgi:hypothetical protein